MDALLFLSTDESYGFPLIEAMFVGLPIICPDLPYARVPRTGALLVRSVIGYLVCLVVALTIGYTFSPKAPPQAEVLAMRPDRVQINGLLNLGARVVAVGERGSVLLSDDQGVSWQPASVATQRNATLTIGNGVVQFLNDGRLATF